MADTKKVITKEFNHIYDYYPLYYLIYGRSKRYKKSEVGGAVFAMKQLAEWNAKSGMIDFQQDGFNVLEILAGQGDHQEYMTPESLTPLKVNQYFNLDIRHHEPVSPEDTRVFVQGNATEYAATTEMDINFIVGYFFTGSTITDAHGNHSRKILVDLFANMKANLKPGGGFLIDYTPSGYAVAMASLTAADSHYQVDVPEDSPIRADFEIDPTSPCLLSYFRDSAYNRLYATCYDNFPKTIQVWANGELKGEITIKKPLTQRYISEPEILDCARDAGFDDFMFFNMQHPRGFYRKLLTSFVVDEDLDYDNSEGLMSTNLLCINK